MLTQDISGTKSVFAKQFYVHVIPFLSKSGLKVELVATRRLKMSINIASKIPIFN